MSNLVDLSKLDEYTRRRILRDLADFKDDKEAFMSLLKQIYLEVICRTNQKLSLDAFLSLTGIYEAFEDYLATFPNIKAKRRRLSVVQNCKEQNCNEKTTN